MIIGIEHGWSKQLILLKPGFLRHNFIYRKPGVLPELSTLDLSKFEQVLILSFFLNGLFVNEKKQRISATTFKTGVLWGDGRW